MWSSILTKLLQALIFPLIDKLWDKLNDYIQSESDKKKAKEIAEAARKKMDEAKTAEEIDDATDDTLSGI